MTNDHKYDDIIGLAHPVSGKRARMSLADRAAQFSPFAALTGFEDAIAETGRRTDRRIELTEGEKFRLNEKIRELIPRMEKGHPVSLTWFRPDLLKEGGEYRMEEVCIRRLDPYGRGLMLEDGRLVFYEDILDLEMETCTK